ncbi:MAG: two-component sensor histidine kinase [Chlorobiota bacterium]|nr:MAG: two-component sensor histidine kinase [Chlorobiota bacterium]
MSDTGLKILIEYLRAASRYRHEFTLISGVFLVASIFLIFLGTGPLLILFFALAALIIFFVMVGKRRHSDLNNIKTTLKLIASREIDLSSELKLNEGLHDIQTELNAMTAKIRSDFIYLKKLEQMRREFLGNVSHELKTPIFAISGYLETLLNGAIRDERVNMHFLSKAYEHTGNLSNLLNDLIDISLIESGQMRMSFRYFNLRNAIQELVDEFSPSMVNSEIELIVHPIRKGLQIYSDKARFRQVMINLLQNAAKYTVQGTIEIIVAEDNQDCTIKVKDTGVGIAEDDLPRIFERFYRVDKARTRDVGGTGLGLAIVKHILEAHETKIEVESTYGQGSTFYFKLKK